MPANNTKPTPPIATGQPYDALFSMVNTTVTELWDDVWPAIDLKTAEPFSETFTSADQTGTELIITHGRGRYPASVMLINLTTGMEIGIPKKITDTTVTVDFGTTLNYSVQAVIS